ncbi:MAG: hypothetical protein V2J24_04805, partial [Pseudomonadales bacterium]|nr:hypothetical protein [Pseudomonadales bacterium]
ISETWTVGLPSNMGATNWGGIAVDGARGLIALPTSSVPFRTKLIPREAADEFVSVILDEDTSEAAKDVARRGFAEAFDIGPDTEIALQEGQPWMMARHAFLDPVLGLPCAGTPFGEVLVIDVAAGQQRWRRPHGTVRDAALLPIGTGMPGMGGPLLTSTGLLFMGGGAERAFRAYDVDTGEELWRHRLPEPGNATPMSYTVETADGPKQFVVIAAGGDARTGIAGTSDHLIAFALPD